MPSIALSAQTGASESRPFKVKAISLPLGVSSFGLDGSEEVVIHIYPDTPGGFYSFHGPSMESVVDQAMAAGVRRSM